MITIGHIELFVHDITIAQHFYCGMLGGELVSSVEDALWISLGSIELLLRLGNREQEPESYQEAAVGIVLYTDDLDRTTQVLKSRGMQFRGTDGNQRCLTFTDPDGHWFQLVNPTEQ